MDRQESGKLDDRIAFRIDKQTKDEFMSRLEDEGKNASDILLKWIKTYIASEPQKEVNLYSLNEDVEKLMQQVAELENIKQQAAGLEQVKQEIAVVRTEFMVKLAALENRIFLSGFGTTS